MPDAAVKQQIVDAFADNVDLTDFGPSATSEYCSPDGFAEVTTDVMPSAPVICRHLPMADRGETSDCQRPDAWLQAPSLVQGAHDLKTKVASAWRHGVNVGCRSRSWPTALNR